MTRRIALATLAWSVLLVPGAAVAAPQIDRAVILSAASPNFAWDGQQAQAAAPQQSAEGFDPNECTKNADYYCDISLVRLEAREGTTASVEFAIKEFNPSFADFDLSIFKSNSAGEPGEEVANGGSLSAAGMEETVPVSEMEPGYYLVTVSYYFSPDATYKGTMKATGIVAPPAAPVTPNPAKAPGASGTRALPLEVSPGAGSARAANRRRRLAVRTTAREEISSLSLVLRDRRGRAVASGRTAHLPAGRHLLRLSVARRLRRGRYTLTCIGVAGARKLTTASRLVLEE